MSADNHTPLPWSTNDHGTPNNIDIICDDGCIANVSRWSNCIADRHSENQANAAYIVRACNAHDELVSVLHAGIALVNDPDAGEDEARAFERLARAALAKVQG